MVLWLGQRHRDVLSLGVAELAVPEHVPSGGFTLFHSYTS